MSACEVLSLVDQNGGITSQTVPTTQTALSLDDRRLVTISDNIAQLTSISELWLFMNAFEEIPHAVLNFMTQLKYLHLGRNELRAIPPTIGRLTALTELWLGECRICSVPREIGRLRALTWLSLRNNRIGRLPAELGSLRKIEKLYAENNRLSWLPVEIGRMPLATQIYLGGNPLPIDVGDEFGRASRSLLTELFETSPTFLTMRERCLTICLGLQELELPALVTLEIIDEALPNIVRMAAKWDLIVAVKHWHQRQAVLQCT